MNKILRLFFVTFLFLIPAVVASASCNIVIDGETLICRDALGNVVEPFVENGTTYVPVRAVSGAFNTSVEWDMDTKTVFLGEKGGAPILNENINIFYNGVEFVCQDVNGTTVFPILREGTTFLPLRGIGELFGKSVFWDNINKSAVLTSTPSDEELKYFTNALTNTKAVSELSQSIVFDGAVLYNGNTVGENSLTQSGEYSPTLFTLDSILPLGFEKNIVYKGEGNYFIYTDSTKFTQTSYIHSARMSQPDMSFSPLYINVFVKNGYIRSISVDTSYTMKKNELDFIGKIKLSSTLEYPPSFRFPTIPYPDNADGESVFSQDANDAVVISDTIENYLSLAADGNAKAIVGMLSKEDFHRLFGQKSENQRNVNYQAMNKKLNSIFRYATGEYEVTEMIYTDPASLAINPDKAARIKITLLCSDKEEKWSEEIELTLIKLDGNWHIDSSMVENLL